MKIEISKRKLESYKRAEIVARECLYQLANRHDENASRLADAVIYWMRSTGKLMYKKPTIKKILGNWKEDT